MILDGAPQVRSSEDSHTKFNGNLLEFLERKRPEFHITSKNLLSAPFIENAYKCRTVYATAQ
jgi:hypothetical protein